MTLRIDRGCKTWHKAAFLETHEPNGTLPLLTGIPDAQTLRRGSVLIDPE